MTDDAITNLNKRQLLKLIADSMSEIKTMRQEHASAVEKMQEMHDQSATVAGKIQSLHDKMYVGEEGEPAVKEQINELLGNLNEVLTDLQEHQKKIKKAKGKMLGYATPDAGGDVVEHPGYISEIQEKLDDGWKGYTELHSQTKKLRTEIEQNLGSAVTTIGLFEAFHDKAKEYKRTRICWEGGLIGLFLLGIVEGGFLYFSVRELSGPDLLLSFLPHLPFVSLFVWPVIFCGRMRAENKKLEEVYNHKWAMAKSFVGYKKSIEELGGEDNDLLTKLMTYVLDAIQQDTSKFVKGKSVDHPVAGALKTTKKGISKLSHPENGA